MTERREAASQAAGITIETNYDEYGDAVSHAVVSDGVIGAETRSERIARILAQELKETGRIYSSPGDF